MEAKAGMVSIVLSVSMLTGHNSRVGILEPVNLSLVLNRSGTVNVKISFSLCNNSQWEHRI